MSNYIKILAIDCFPNMERMEQLLKKGGNQNFKKMILEGYSHDLVKGNPGYDYKIINGKMAYFDSKSNLSIDDSVINRIIDWINKQ